MKTLTLLSLATLMASAALGRAQQIQVSVDGTPVQFSGTNPMMSHGRVMVPLRGVFEQMGATVRWNPMDQSVSANAPGKQVNLIVGDTLATVNGRGIRMDSAPLLMQDRVMVPLRFISESLGAHVDWNASTYAVAITSAAFASNTDMGSSADSYRTDAPIDKMAVLSPGTVIPVTLNGDLSSNGSVVGDKFTATVNTGSDSEYAGLPVGTIIEGHVDVARAMTSGAPGVLGLAFDRVRLTNGRDVAISGSLFGTDPKSVDNTNGRLVARNGTQNKNLQFAGYGAGAGALLAIVTKGNLLSDAVIGGALGYLFGSTKDTSKYRDVSLHSGAEFGVRLNRQLSISAR